MYLASLIKKSGLWLSYLTFQIGTFLVCFQHICPPESRETKLGIWLYLSDQSNFITAKFASSSLSVVARES